MVCLFAAANNNRTGGGKWEWGSFSRFMPRRCVLCANIKSKPLQKPLDLEATALTPLSINILPRIQRAAQEFCVVSEDNLSSQCVAEQTATPFLLFVQVHCFQSDTFVTKKSKKIWRVYFCRILLHSHMYPRSFISKGIMILKVKEAIDTFNIRKWKEFAKFWVWWPPIFFKYILLRAIQGSILLNLNKKLQANYV